MITKLNININGGAGTKFFGEISDKKIFVFKLNMR